ncbi:esterase [Mariniphaga sp.]|uniref:esterase n=1 Tax=Mariniphaga sp. TaxID=1954475 RepID=UPI003563F90C
MKIIQLKNHLFLTLMIAAFFSFSVNAQQSLFGGEQIVSPEIHEDNSVTFRVNAPDAEEVKLAGEWMPSEGWTPGSAAMQKSENGIWSFTTEPLEPELYSYSFIIDGFRTTDPNNPFIVRDVASVMNIFIIGGEQADLYKVNNVPHGTVARRWYDSPSLGKNRRLTIYTPPGYENSAEKYPVLYLLHGAGGDEEAWITLGRTAQIMDNLIAQRKAKPMIVVMPNGNVIQDAAPGEGTDGFYKPQFMVPKTMDGTYEASFPDIIKFLENNYRVKAEKASRAIAGLSMGGFHSLHISRYYHNMFDYVGLFSAAILPNQDVSHEVYENIDGTLKTQMENGYELYWIGMGKTDFLYDSGVQYRQKLDSMGMKYIYRESGGGHVWRNWRVYLSEFAPLLFE